MMDNSIAVPWPANEEISGLPFHPVAEALVPTRPGRRHARSCDRIDEFAADRLLPISVTFQPHDIGFVITGKEFHADNVEVAIEQRPEALLDPMLELRRPQVSFQLVLSLVSHWVLALVSQATRLCNPATFRWEHSRSEGGRLGCRRRVRAPGTQIRRP